MAKSDTSTGSIPESVAPTSSAPTTGPSLGPTLKDYGIVTSVLSAFSLGLYLTCRQYAGEAADVDQLFLPLFAMLGLIGLVWFVMLVFRNYAILSNITSGVYYERYLEDDHPPDWVERPARTFNNLMQVPPLFFLACILMLFTGYLDLAQLLLVWIFVATRYLHATIYIVWNYVPARFGCYIAGVITLFVIFIRLAPEMVS